MISITLSAPQYEALQRHLFQGTVEQVAFLFCEWTGNIDSSLLTVVDSFEVPRDGFEIHSAFHVELSDAILPLVIKRAWDSSTCLVEVHSHITLEHDAEFSGSDLWGLHEFVPHVRWRLTERPYAALVFTFKNFDALVWAGKSSNPVALTELRIGDSRRLFPTDLTLKALEGRTNHGNFDSL